MGANLLAFVCLALTICFCLMATIDQADDGCFSSKEKKTKTDGDDYVPAGWYKGPPLDRRNEHRFEVPLLKETVEQPQLHKVRSGRVEWGAKHVQWEQQGDGQKKEGEANAIPDVSTFEVGKEEEVLDAKAANYNNAH